MTLAAMLPPLTNRAAMLAVVLPSDIAFSHLTAALIWGWPIPEPPPGTPVDVIRHRASARLRRPDVLCHRGIEQRTIVTLHGLRVTSAADTWIDLAGTLAPEAAEETLVRIGRLIRRYDLGATPPEIAVLMQRRLRLPQRAVLRAALSRI